METAETDTTGIRVSVTSSGICGSDLHLASFGPSWVTLGHEFCGRLDDGTPVAVLPVVPCGTCDRCVAGNEQQWPTPSAPFTASASTAGWPTRCGSTRRCAKVASDGLSLDHANLVEPLAVALHGVNRAGVVAGMRVWSSGPDRSGCAPSPRPGTWVPTSTSTATVRNRIGAGERLGATHRRSATDYDVVLDAAGTQSSLDRAIDWPGPAAPSRPRHLLGSGRARSGRSR